MKSKSTTQSTHTRIQVLLRGILGMLLKISIYMKQQLFTPPNHPSLILLAIYASTLYEIT
jgi:hypothetical protein